jgi:gluconokinase
MLADRMQHRLGHYMPVSLLASQLDTLEPLEPDEPGIVLPTNRPVEELVKQIVQTMPQAVQRSA